MGEGGSFPSRSLCMYIDCVSIRLGGVRDDIEIRLAGSWRLSRPIFGGLGGVHGF